MKWAIALAGSLTGLFVASRARRRACSAPGHRHSVVHGRGGERAVVRTNRGLIIEDPASESFRIVCNDAFEASLVGGAAARRRPPTDAFCSERTRRGSCFRAPTLAASSSIAGAFDGLLSDRREGRPPGRRVRGGAAARRELRRAAAELGPGPNGEVARDAARRANSARGRALGQLATLRVEHDCRGQPFVRTAAHFRDAGRTFDGTPIELDASELRVFLLAVDPTTRT